MLSEIPEGWTATPFEQLATLQSGFAFKSANFVDDESAGLPVIRIRDLEKQLPVKFYSGDVPDEYIVEKGDVLIGMDGEFNCVEWMANNGALNQRVLRVYETEKAARKFLLYRLIPIVKDLEGKISGTTVKHLSVKHLKVLSIPTPPLNEQKRIAEILSSVDESIQATQAVIEQAERVKRGLMEELLTGGLGSEAIERGEVPDGWVYRSLEELLELSTPGFWGKADGNDDMTIPVLRATNFTSSGINYETAALRSFPFKKIEQKSLVKGDILLERSGGSPSQPVGRVRRFDSEGRFSFSNFFQLIRADRAYVDSLFLFYMLDNFYLKGNTAVLQKATTGIRNLAFKEYLATSFPVPPLNEQHRIAEILSSVDETIASHKANIEQQSRVKKGLMDDLLTGKVRTV